MVNFFIAESPQNKKEIEALFAIASRIESPRPSLVRISSYQERVYRNRIKKNELPDGSPITPIFTGFGGRIPVEEKLKKVLSSLSATVTNNSIVFSADSTPIAIDTFSPALNQAKVLSSFQDLFTPEQAKANSPEDILNPTDQDLDTWLEIYATARDKK